MSTSILYHAWGLKDYQYVRTEYAEGEVRFHIRKKEGEWFCPACGSNCVTTYGQVERSWKTIPVGTRPVRLVSRIQRLECQACMSVLQDPVSFAAPKKTYTRQLARYVLDLCRKCTVADVSELVGLHWHTVQDILKNDLEARSKRIDWKNLKNIAIDEISVRKGHKYLTVVMDLHSGNVVFVAETNRKEALAPFFKKLRRSKTRLEAIAMDMHKPFRLAVEEYYRRSCPIVYDRFHVMKLFHTELDEIRREEVHRIEDVEGRKIIKGLRYILLQPGEHLLPKGKARLDELLALNTNLSKAYVLKEALRTFWDCRNYREGEAFLKEWINQALTSGVSRLRKFVGTLLQHWNGLMAYFAHPISTGPLEGTNNKIKVLKRKAYGYRNIKFFMLRILFIHECKHKIAGT